MVDAGPCLDIYALSNDRSHQVLTGFVDAYADVQASEDRGDEQLMMVPLGYEGPLSDLGVLVQWDWRPSGSLSNILSLGLAHPIRAFRVYLTPRDMSLCRVMVSFTRDGRLILGLSLPDTEETGETLARAASLLSDLMRRSGAAVGLVAVEMPPPLDGSDFENLALGPKGPRVLSVTFGDAEGIHWPKERGE